MGNPFKDPLPFAIEKAIHSPHTCLWSSVTVGLLICVLLLGGGGYWYYLAGAAGGNPVIANTSVSHAYLGQDVDLTAHRADPSLTPRPEATPAPGTMPSLFI